MSGVCTALSKFYKKIKTRWKCFTQNFTTVSEKKVFWRRHGAPSMIHSRWVRWVVIQNSKWNCSDIIFYTIKWSGVRRHIEFNWYESAPDVDTSNDDNFINVTRFHQSIDIFKSISRFRVTFRFLRIHALLSYRCRGGSIAHLMECPEVSAAFQIKMKYIIKKSFW